MDAYFKAKNIKNNINKENNMRKTRAYFILFGDRLDPQFWTDFFRREPASFKRPGERVSWRAGRSLPNRLDGGFWNYSASDAPLTNSIDEQIFFLATELGLPSPHFKKAKKDNSVECQFSIYVYNGDGDNPPSYSPHTEDLIKKCQAKIVLDVWNRNGD